MDWSLLALVFTSISLAIGLYWWEEPQIKGLEEKRIKYIKILIDNFLNDNKKDLNSDELSNKLAYFVKTAYINHRQIILPVKELTPYKKIAIYLSIALILSFIYGIINASFIAYNISINGGILKLTMLADILSLIIIALVAIASMYGIQEFRYIKRMNNIFEKSIFENNPN